MEPQDEAFIRSMVDQGFATEAETTTHNGKLVWRTGAAIRPRRNSTPKHPRAAFLFQTVPEEKTVKNRVHWDVRLDGRGQGRGPRRT